VTIHHRRSLRLEHYDYSRAGFYFVTICTQGKEHLFGDIVGAFKSLTTNTYIKMVKNKTLPPFNKRIWQRNYYEHVIRDDVDYERIEMYIVNNPLTWEDDVLSENEK